MTPPHLDIEGLEPDDVPHLEHAIRLAYAARDRGDHPFGAILVTPDGAAAVHEEFWKGEHP